MLVWRTGPDDASTLTVENENGKFVPADVNEKVSVLEGKKVKFQPLTTDAKMAVQYINPDGTTKKTEFFTAVVPAVCDEIPENLNQMMTKANDMWLEAGSEGDENYCAWLQDEFDALLDEWENCEHNFMFATDNTVTVANDSTAEINPLATNKKGPYEGSYKLSNHIYTPPVSPFAGRDKFLTGQTVLLPPPIGNGYLVTGYCPMVTDVADCDDGIDNDSDGWADMDDPGCNTSTDKSEVNTITASTPECSNEQDDDGDGLIDGYDPGCNEDPNDTDEEDTILGIPVELTFTVGTVYESEIATVGEPTTTMVKASLPTGTISNTEVTFDLEFTGSADKDIDYSLTGESITIDAGQNSGKVILTTIDDDVPEGLEP